MDWDEKPEINITPLVDVMLVLVAILMLTMPMLLFEERIAVPKGSKQAPIGESASIVIRIDAKKDVWVGKQKFEFESFPDSFMLYSNQFPDRTHKVLIAADGDINYKDIVYILKSVKAARFTQIALVTNG
ncbi:MAG: biopolymer transporter ExbD [Helicobacteraceae bacterium]|jgi:biopolymer transport protein ExbD|nr:biopolymer transporter ExbD [Helicobacteraceae bacterium]MDR2033315.1 biopolymer transporter ExbD [Helicobacteraceae bacterium]